MWVGIFLFNFIFFVIVILLILEFMRKKGLIKFEDLKLDV